MSYIKFTFRYLFIFLLIFLLIDLILFLYLIKPTLNSKKLSNTRNAGGVNSEIRIIRGDLNKGSLDEAEISVIILTNAEIDRSSKKFTIRMNFLSSNNDYVIAANLGKNEDELLINKKSESDWIRQSVSSVVPLLNKDTPIKLRFYIQDPNSLINSPQCNTKCKEELKKVQTFIKTNNKIIKTLRDGFQPDTKLTIGALTAISFN